MPRNFKEAMFFTTLMCSLMVLGMSIYNLLLVGHFTIEHLLIGYFPAFIVAFLADVLIVGALAKKIAFTFLKDHHKRWQKIMVISGLMLLGMVTLMSFYGLLVNKVPISISSYAIMWLTNVAMAIPLNFIVVGPFSRFVLQRIQKPLAGEEFIEDFEDDDVIPEII